MAHETGAILSLSRCGRGILTQFRKRAFWSGGGPSCTFPDRREATVFRRRFPPSCAPPTFSISLSGRRSESPTTYEAGPKRWTERAKASGNSHCGPTYTDISEIQRDLDVFMEKYNLRRSHQGFRLKGRTPAQTLRDALGIDDPLPLDFTAKKESPKAELPPAA